MPFIPVIIVAHNRKEFLLDASNSALNQALPKDEYEITFVKNFFEYDDVLKTLSENVFSNEENQGADIVNV